MKLKSALSCSAALAVVLGLAFPANAGVTYTWNNSFTEGDWSDPDCWGGSGYPLASDDIAKFYQTSATVNMDVTVKTASVANQFNDGNIVFIGGHTLEIAGSSWKISNGAKIEAKGTGTKVYFSGAGCKYVYGSGGRFRASEGGVIQVNGFKPGDGMWNLNNPPTDFYVEAIGSGSQVILRGDNHTDGFSGSRWTFTAKDGGLIQHGYGRGATQYGKNSNFQGTDQVMILDNGRFENNGQASATPSSLIMDGAGTGQRLEMKGDNPTAYALGNVRIGNGSNSVQLKFVPEDSWSLNLSTVRIVAGVDAIIGAKTSLVIDGSVLGKIAGTKIIPLIKGTSSLSVAAGAIANAQLVDVDPNAEVSFVTKDDDSSLPAANTLYLKLVSSITPVDAPTVTGVVYDGNPHTPVVATSANYTITELPQNVVTAGTYMVVLTLNGPKMAWRDTGLSTPRLIPFIVSRAPNSWITPPALSKTEWEYGDAAAAVTMGVAQYGTCAVTYDGDQSQMPTGLGDHVAVFTTVGDINHVILSNVVNYTVIKMVTRWITEPDVQSWSIEDSTPPPFPMPVPNYGTVICYYDGNTGITTRPETTFTPHSVTYLVEGDDTHSGIKQTFGYYIGYKFIGPNANPYGYRITNLGDDGKDVALVFTNVGYSAGSPMDFSLPSGIKEIHYLVVGGGGSGGLSQNAHGAGGGGAGAVKEETVAVGNVERKLNVYVGAGGRARNEEAVRGETGGNSMLQYGSVVVLTRGGGGGGYMSAGLDGGCGGGAGNNSYSTDPSTLVGGKGIGGYAGGNGSKSNYLGGGGGGAGGAGASTGDGGTGGSGVYTEILGLDPELLTRVGGFGTDGAFAGGGGSSILTGTNGSPIGGGGSGNGSSTASIRKAYSGTRYGAGGGGGSGPILASGAGYRGIVIVRYKIPDLDGCGLFVIVQ